MKDFQRKLQASSSFSYEVVYLFMSSQKMESTSGVIDNPAAACVIVRNQAQGLCFYISVYFLETTILHFDFKSIAKAEYLI